MARPDPRDSDPAPLFTRLSSAVSDRYRIERELGAGGMATVYLAEDLKHHRKVAIKVLHAELSALLGPERFLREIELTANLQHPHILPLFDSGSADGLLYYVMPFVEGETLRARLERERQLPIADVVRIAAEVADALHYAHERSVIHRDIKPENILLQNGHALVADFGIALAVEQAGGQRMTQTGLSLGTPQYMSPEQAMGERSVDARSDIYALGAVTYEMLAGEPPFTGPTAQAIVAKVMTEVPKSLSAQRHSVPARLDVAVATALEKLPADRFASAAEFSRALTSTDGTGFGQPLLAAGGRRPFWRDARNWVTATALLALALVASIAWRASGSKDAGVRPPAATFVVSSGILTSNVRQRMAISPDGSMLAFVALAPDSGRVHQRLFRRALDRLETVPIAGSDSAADPFFSPDGSWIAYYTGTAFEKVPIAGGTPVTIADSIRGATGATWTDQDAIVFTWKNGLWRLPEGGGRPEVIVRDSTMLLEQPIVLPGKDRYLFFACRVGSCGALVPTVIDPSTHRMRTLTPDPAIAAMWFVPPRTLLLQRESGELSSVELDLATLTLRGAERRNIPSQLGISLAGAELAFSREGTLAVAPEVTRAEGQLVWVDRSGKVTPITDQARSYLFPRVSPDGRKIAMEIHDESANGFIWVYDLRSQTLTRITSKGHSTRPAWSPDSKRVAYVSLRGDSTGIYVTPVDRSTPERALYVGRVSFLPLSWSPDGKWIATEAPSVASSTGAPQHDVIVIPVGGGAPRVIVKRTADNRRPVFSADGKWLAYISNESGRWEVYVTPFPGPGGRWAVTNGGGDEPAWPARDSEIFYRAPDGWLTAATLSLGSDVTVTRRQRLFSMQLSGEFLAFGESPYDAAPDGQRFVMVKSQSTASSIIVSTNWIPRVLAESGK